MTSILAFILWIASLQGARVQPQLVSGTVLNNDNGQPFAGIVVTLVSLDAPAIPERPAGNSGVGPRGGVAAAAGAGARGGGRGNVSPTASNVSRTLSATTDLEGRFSFSGVPPGHYSISAERENFIRQEFFQAGERGPLELVLNVVPSINREELLLTLFRNPAISGTVYDPDGKRLAAAIVRAYRIQYTPTGRELLRVAEVLSNDGGEYRLFDLPLGAYVVTASYSDHARQHWNAVLKLSSNLVNADDGYSTIYYPSELNLANAKTIRLSDSHGVADVDLAFKESRYFQFKATILLPDPPPELRNLRVALLPVGTDLGAGEDYSVQGKGLVFTVDRLAEGDYVAVAVADIPDLTGKLIPVVVSDTQLVRMNQDVEITIAVTRPFDIRGRIIADGFPAPGGMQIQLVRVDRLVKETFNAAVDGSGNFRLRDVGPGVYDVFLQGMPAKAYLREAGFSAQDRYSMRIQISTAQPSRAQDYDAVTKSSRLTSISTLTGTLTTGGSVTGNVLDGGGQNAANADIVLVPSGLTDRSRKDRYYVTRSDADGAFHIDGIATGTYNAYAFQRIEPDIYYDAGFNTALAARSVPVTAGPNISRAVRLNVISTDELAGMAR